LVLNSTGDRKHHSIRFAPEGTPFGQTTTSAGRLTQHRVATSTKNHGLSVRKYGGYRVASGTLDVHKITVGRLDQPFQFVLSGFGVGRRVQQIDVHLGVPAVVCARKEKEKRKKHNLKKTI